MYVEEAAWKTKNIKYALATVATMLQLTSYRYPSSADVSDCTTYDYIVVGAGSAGCVVANRLTEDPNVSVLLIEAGGDPPIESNIPALLSYTWNSRLDWNHKSQVDKEYFQCHQNNQLHLGHGKVLGGSSSTNHMFYVRGDPHDYNTWAEITGDSTWNYTNVLPYFKKSEKLNDPTILNSKYADFHGAEGCMEVTRTSSDKAKKYLEALEEMGFESVMDTNGPNTLGFNEQLVTLSHGIRQSTANAFLSTIKDRPNLYVMKESLATNIIIDENKVARGVHVINKNDEKITVNANKEIIISAGTINSAQLLLLSGIGPKEELQKINQTVVADLPVGEKLQEHKIVMLVIKMAKSTNKPKSVDPHDYPLYAVNGFVGLNNSHNVPSYQAIILGTNAEGIVTFCSETFFLQNRICQAFYEQTKDSDTIAILIYDFNSKPRGHISLNSLDPEDSPNIHINSFPDEDDLDNYISYIEDITRIVNTSYFESSGAELVTLPECEDFEEGSKDYWKCYIKCMGTTSMHYTSTCSMGSVVDSQLCVYGVKCLRVADASVMPTITSGNTNVPTIMIGEKAADMVKEDNRCYS